MIFETVVKDLNSKNKNSDLSLKFEEGFGLNRLEILSVTDMLDTGNDGERSLSMNIMKNQICFSSRNPSSLEMLSISQTSKMDSKSLRVTSLEDGRLGGSSGDARYYDLGFLYAPWNEISHLKRRRSSNDELLSDAQDKQSKSLVYKDEYFPIDLLLSSSYSDRMGVDEVMSGSIFLQYKFVLNR
ncbi:hypothetical protein CR513_24407, partial [Mucuna pruriens]